MLNPPRSKKYTALLKRMTAFLLGPSVLALVPILLDFAISSPIPRDFTKQPAYNLRGHARPSEALGMPKPTKLNDTLEPLLLSMLKEIWMKRHVDEICEQSTG